jgi:hypothetical protein
LSTADAVVRETNWLTAYNPGDGLPALLSSLGGPFDVVQAYFPRTPATRQVQMYVTRRAISVERFGFSRKIINYPFVLRIIWPLSSQSGSAEDVQQAMDNAVELVLQRVNGPLVVPIDKTHGAQFMSVAEDPCVIGVDFGDPEQAVGQGQFRATVTYTADDRDYLS